MSADDKITVEQYLQRMKSDENQTYIFELFDGIISEIPLYTRKQAHIVTQLYARLNYHVDTHTGGHVLGVTQGYILDEHTVLNPDISYVTARRVDDGLSQYIQDAPNLAIEVVDHSSYKHDQQRIHYYLNHGADMVWIIFADESCAELYTLDQGVLQLDELGFGDTLTAPAILPEFELPLYTIFPSNRM